MIDITLKLNEKIITFPGDPSFEMSLHSTIEKDRYSIKKFSMSTHSGTHIDAPAHFLEEGETVEKINLDILCGDVLVIDACECGTEINEEFFNKKIEEIKNEKRILLKTINENLLNNNCFSEDYAHITEDGARYLRRNTQVRLIGIDYISIESSLNLSFPVHKEFLCKTPPIYILEAIDLRNVKPGKYHMICLPLPIVGGDGAPARVILMHNNEKSK